MVSGSGFGEVLREEMEVKHELGYRVTLQMVLMADSAELELEREGDSELDTWMRAASRRPITKVKQMRAEMVRMEKMGFWGLGDFGFEV